jgi:hypothetical protein
VKSDLDSFNRDERRQALLEICADAKWPEPGADLNLHAHTFFSYNAYGYSPTHFAVLARQRGLAYAGIVDFDVLDGLEEFYEAGDWLGLKTVVSMETRVFVPEFETRVVNSPGEPGIAYHMGVGFPRFVEHPTLRKTSEQRNRQLVARVNTFTAPVTLDYDRDVLPLTPNGNATERHICEAYAKKASPEFWRSKVGEGENLPALIRAKLMKQGGVGYVLPDSGSFPTMAEFNRFVLEAGAIPTLTWLDGTSEGEQAIEELFEVAIKSGAAALNIIPDRNLSTPGKIKHLRDVVALAQKHDFPVVVGTEMNAPGNKFVDDFTHPVLKELLPVLRHGAQRVYEHVLKQRSS